MVHPLMRQSSSTTSDDADAVARTIIDMLPRLHVLVTGPGLGRDELMQATVARVIRAARERRIPIVIDADALLAVQADPDLVRGYKEAILTPNVVEFERLCKAIGVEVQADSSETKRVEALANALGGVTVIQKGAKDFISNGTTTLVNTLEGGLKRSGGQGDTLTGAIATFLAWRKAYIDGLWKDESGQRLTDDEMIGLAAFGGSAITRVSQMQTCFGDLMLTGYLGVLTACICKEGPQPAS